MIEMVEYKAEHLAALRIGDGDFGARPNHLSGPAMTFMLGDQPIAIFGWYAVTAGTVQLWAVLGKDIHKRKKSFHKTVKNLIRASFDKCQIHRMQMSVKVGFKEGWDWAKALGFTSEGVMRRYGSEGHDYWLFARIKD
jgi:hypothetical protein